MWEWVKKHWQLVLLTLLFAVSVGVRWPAFSLPDDSHYSNTWDRFTNYEVFKHVGYDFKVYDTYTLKQHKFASYVGASPDYLVRKGIPDLYVYTSFAPTLFVVPYVIFKLVGAPANLISLDVFNLVLQFITTILIYYLLLEILPKRDRKRREPIAFLCATAYIFSTGTLQGHMNVYWAHELLQPFFVGTMLLFARRKGLLCWWEAAIAGFALSVIAWTGVFGVIGIVGYSLYQFRKTKNAAFLRAIYGLAGGAVLAIGLVMAQALFVTDASFGRYISTIFGRVAARTAEGSIYTPVLVVRQFITRLFEDYGVYIIMMYSMLCAYACKIKPNFAWSVVLVSGFPVLESFVLVEHDSVYAFGRLKWLLPIILALGLLSYEFLDGRHKARRWKILIGLFALAAIVHALIYYDIFIRLD